MKTNTRIRQHVQNLSVVLILSYTFATSSLQALSSCVCSDTKTTHTCCSNQGACKGKHKHDPYWKTASSCTGNVNGAGGAACTVEGSSSCSSNPCGASGYCQ